MPGRGRTWSIAEKSGFPRLESGSHQPAYGEACPGRQNRHPSQRGDPFVYGRGGEEAQVLAGHGVDFEVIPGITAGIAAPACAGIPVTHREYGSSFALITGHRKQGAEEELRWNHLARGVDTLAIYMGVKNLPYIREQLLSHGKSPDTPVALIQWGTTGAQYTVTGTLGEVIDLARQHEIKSPTMIVIGEVVRLREQLAWFENRDVTKKEKA